MTTNWANACGRHSFTKFINLKLHAGWMALRIRIYSLDFFLFLDSYVRILIYCAASLCISRWVEFGQIY